MKDLYQLSATDPEFIERHELFVSEEVQNEHGQELDDETRYLAILATLIGSQSLEVFKLIAGEAIEAEFSPVMIKEVVYQAVDYLGMGRVYPFILASNEVFTEKGISIPLENQATTSMADRLEKGSEAQVAIFGPGMKDFWKGGHINRWLAANCFGDYYTRKGLDLKQRELITFCYLSAQGGCENQLASHVFGNLNLGNSKELLIKVVSQCLPYIGYPRSLNAIATIEKVTTPVEK